MALMRIRSATHADTTDIRRVVFTVLKEYGLETEPCGLDADLDNVETTYIAPGGMFEIVETDDGRVVGTVGLFTMSDGVCELRKMYLLPEARGMGLGKTMMDRVLEHARTHGFRRMELETAGVLVEAKALYKRYGFSPIENAHVSSRCDEAFALDLADSEKSASSTDGIVTRRSAVIFDFDGTLTKPNLDFDSIRAEIGIEGGVPILEAMTDFDDESRRRAEQILARHEWEAAISAELQDGAVEVIASCRANGHPVAILTRNTRLTLEHVLGHYGLVVDATRTRDDGTIKPSPEPVFSICREIEADPTRSWMVGDHLFDILTGRAAGARTVLLVGDRPNPDHVREADHVIHRLTDLLPLLNIALS